MFYPMKDYQEGVGFVMASFYCLHVVFDFLPYNNNMIKLSLGGDKQHVVPCNECLSTNVLQLDWD